MSMQNINNLSAAETERLAILLEELGEAQQAIGKIMRHGYESCHPERPEKTNRQDLAKELGHIDLAVQVMFVNGDLSASAVRNSRIDKSLSIEDYLHHQNNVPVRDFNTHKFEFEGTSRVVGRTVSETEIVREVCVWTDGVSLCCDMKELAAFRMEPGVRYRVTVERIGK